MMAPNKKEPPPVNEKDINKRIGATIRIFRLERRIQQKVIAAHLNITAEQFQHMERGDSFITVARLLLINRFMGVSNKEFQIRLRRKLGRRSELFHTNVYSRLSDGLVADFLTIPNKTTRELIRALIRECANE
ncbi:MAG: hypothetical protein COA81_11510 [Alphaproteobacteria bacterium]|nr:MAG: hypothetical protein COA81_11510 [Alphaproteobacteria bacterium]